MKELLKKRKVGSRKLSGLRSGVASTHNNVLVLIEEPTYVEERIASTHNNVLVLIEEPTYVEERTS